MNEMTTEVLFFVDTWEKAQEVVNILCVRFCIDRKYFHVSKNQYGPESEYLVRCNLIDEMIEFLAEQKGVY